jgi:hypothetical protein
VGAFLVNTGGQPSSDVAARIHTQLGPTVTDVAATRRQIGSSLTSVTLAALAAGALAVTRYVRRPAIALLRDL